jgi:hypothetical protein
VVKNATIICPKCLSKKVKEVMEKNEENKTEKNEEKNSEEKKTNGEKKPNPNSDFNQKLKPEEVTPPIAAAV